VAEGKQPVVKRLLTCLLFIAILFSVCSAQDVAEYTYRWSRPGGEGDGTVRFSLGGDWLEFQDEARWIRHNFADKKSLVRRDDAVEQFSLYSDLGFRVAELQNRLEIQKALDEAEVEDLDFKGQPIFLEHLFGLEASGAEDPQLETLESGARFSYEGTPLMEFEFTDRSVEEEEARELARFLRYYFGGHPDALAYLQQQRRVPKRIVMHSYNAGKTAAMELSLVSRETGEKTNFPSPTWGEDDSLSRLLKKTDSLSVGRVAERHNETEQEALTALEEEKYFLSLLRFLEAKLNTGKAFDATFAESREALMKDEDCQLLLSALSGAAPGGLKVKLTALDRLEEKAGEAGYVLKLLRGSLLLGAERPLEAQEILLDVLQRSPEISSAWKDLGDTYYGQFRANEAWQCWDMGRSLCPANPHFREVEQLEALLTVSYPEFF